MKSLKLRVSIHILQIFRRLILSDRHAYIKVFVIIFVIEKLFVDFFRDIEQKETDFLDASYLRMFLLMCAKNYSL